MKILRDSGSVLGGSDGGGGGAGGAGGAGGGNGDWKAGLPAEIRDDPSMKNIADVGALAKGYIHAQKLVGADKIAKPQANWSEQQWSEYWQAGGRPETLDKYEVPKDIKLEDGVQLDEAKLKAAREMFHKSGLSVKQADAVLRYYMASLNDAVKGERGRTEQAQAASVAKLKEEYGVEYDANIDVARSALRRFGSPELVEFLNTSGLGNNVDLIRAFHKVGKAISEDHTRGQGQGLFVKSETAATQEINRLVNDKEFMEALNQRTHPGHKDAVEKWIHLHSVAYPGKLES